MAQSFLERFYELVLDCVGDPTTSRRLTKSKMLRDFKAQEALLWERLMRATGQSSLLGRAEAAYDLTSGKEFYPLPGNCRQFIAFEKRINGDPNQVQERYASKPFFDGERGIEIISGERGFRIFPVPIADSADWTMVYLKGPIHIHAATASHVGENSIALGAPGTDAGALVRVDGYYVGSMVRVYDATAGAPQSREVTAQSTGATITCQLRHPWTPKPTGTVLYEFRPELPEDYDSIYGIMVAMTNMPRRNNPQRYRMLQKDFQDLYDGCRSWVTSNVADRGPTMNLPQTDDDMAIYSVDYA